MAMGLRLLVLGVTVVALACASHSRGESPAREADPKVEFFEKKIRPLLAGNCYNCHSANTNSRGGLRLDDRNGMIAGGGSGPAVVPGQPDKSLLLRAVRHTSPDLQMPPKKQLSEEQVADLTRWIRDGAAWPKVKVPALGNHEARYRRLREEHWAWQPLREQAPPAAGTGSDVDRFVAAKRNETGLAAVGFADRATLIRRVTFDLTGLPPTPEEIGAFVADRSAAAYERLVDRLLASPAYGERWGRHWLDVARYAESTGPSRNIPYPHAWRYRDYVIDAFNHDRPFDRFVREQVAGDLLPAGSPAERDEHLVATGFLALGVKDVNQRFKVRFVMDNIDEQIDVIGRGLLALTVSCARCHDHKFDPIPTTDYYALAGILHSTDLCGGVRNKMGGGGLDYYDTAMLLRLGPDVTAAPAYVAKVDKAQTDLAAARAEVEALRGKPEGNAPGPDGKPKLATARHKMNQLQAALVALTDPAANGPVAFGVRDAKVVGDTELRVRGEAEKLGPTVPRGYLSAVTVPGAVPVNPRQSGRLELAQWLTSEHNPLTSRVIVNRVWQHLFGRGLVSSVDNFGVTGDQPSHPELLDYLALRFVRDGWSIKRLVRTLVLSQTYQLGSDAPEANRVADPANRLLWRHSPRRLDAEEIRDASLAAAGRLDRNRPSASPAKDLKLIELSDDGAEARRLIAAAQTSTNRSVYLPLLRGLTPRSLEVFDFADQGLVTGSRDATTVAPQALYMLNDPFVRRQALALAERVLGRTDLDDGGRVSLVYQTLLGRVAAGSEIERARAYLADYEVACPRAMPVARRSTGEPLAVAPAAAAAIGSTAQAVAKRLPTRTTGPPKDEAIVARDPKTAAWASFCQALLASAEFRYLR